VQKKLFEKESNKQLFNMRER